jgi:23S rRNA (cytosine1962-C5)-methyltransferase
VEAPAPETAPDEAPAPPPLPPSVTVRAGHVQPLWAGHPWVFKQAVERVDDGVRAGDEVLVVDPHGKVLGRGLYSPASAIAVRLFTQEGGRSIDAALLRDRIERAVKLRQAYGLPDATPGAETTGFRLVHGEGDGLPGLIVDGFGDVLVVQLGTAGLRRLEAAVVDSLREVLGPKTILDRTPKNIAQAEGFAMDEAIRVLHGELPPTLRFAERGLLYELPLELGQKTGFYFDQRPLRDRIGTLSRGSRVLDAFSYVGATALHAARGGAREVWAVDTSVPAVLAGAKCAELNGLDEVVTFEALEAARAFRKAAEEGGWDLVICDPPKLGGKRRGRHRGGPPQRPPDDGYRRLAAGACAAVRPGGLLVFCSCSAATGMDALQRHLALGARDAGRRAVVVERLFQGPDHPVAAAFPEGLYLKVLLARVEAG